ncbi:MAG: hypothetical protein ACI9MR_003917 [Myxococcota bacterium]|jgi:uncharacterized protein with PIN domain
MQRNRGIFLLLGAIALPFIWIVVTSDFTDGGSGAIVLVGGSITYVWVASIMWRAHRRGRLMPHSCETCQNPMHEIATHQLRPPKGTDRKALPRWRCKRCGRLA